MTVFPSLAATRSIALVTFRFARACESNASNACRAWAAKAVPAHVRTSFALISFPEIVPQIIVHVGRTDAVCLSLFVAVLEKLLSGQLLAAPYDSGEGGRFQVELPIDPAFSSEVERDICVLGLRHACLRIVVSPKEWFC